MSGDSWWDYTVLALILIPCAAYVIHRARRMFGKGGGGCGGCCGCDGAKPGKAG